MRKIAFAGFFTALALTACGGSSTPSQVKAQDIPFPNFNCAFDSSAWGTATWSTTPITVYRNSPPATFNTGIKFNIPNPLNYPGTVTATIPAVTGFTFSANTVSSYQTGIIPFMIKASSSVSPGTYHIWMYTSWSRKSSCNQFMEELIVTVQ